jgi:hypothetical protein
LHITKPVTQHLLYISALDSSVSAAIAEYVQRRHRLRLLELEGKIEFDPRWDYKKMRTA